MHSPAHALMQVAWVWGLGERRMNPLTPDAAPQGHEGLTPIAPCQAFVRLKPPHNTHPMRNMVGRAVLRLEGSCVVAEGSFVGTLVRPWSRLCNNRNTPQSEHVPGRKHVSTFGGRRAPKANRPHILCKPLLLGRVVGGGLC